MKQLLMPVQAKHKYQIPEWVKNAPDDVFPAKTKRLYTYLLVFGVTGCWQWNCRIARRFHTTDRTIRRWLNWLKAHKLIEIRQPFNSRRVIVAHQCKDFLEFLARPLGHMPPPQPKKHRLTEAKFALKRDRTVSLFGLNPRLPNLPGIIPPVVNPCG